MTGGVPGVYDLHWTPPAILTGNGGFCLVGVNVYRSFDSEYGPYHRITELPVGSLYWQDRTGNELVIEEDVTDRVTLKGDAGSFPQNPRWAFQVRYPPIVREGSQATPTRIPQDVRAFVDGVETAVLAVWGDTGEVEIDTHLYPNVTYQTLDKPLLPSPGSRVTVTYRRNRSLLRTDLNTRVFYRVTSVAYPASCSAPHQEDLLETPLDRAPMASTQETEKLDWVWRDAIERNRWILEQGGERVRVFIKKTVGVPCFCFQEPRHKQPLADCRDCYGSGILGGYEGPWDILIAPDDAERRKRQSERGRTIEHSYETWTGPSPQLDQRDFLVKLNGRRYSIGAVRTPTARGMVLQQHFTMSQLDEKDIRYSVPLGNPVKHVATTFTPLFAPPPPDITNHPTVPEEIELKGRTRAWVNTSYLRPLAYHSLRLEAHHGFPIWFQV